MGIGKIAKGNLPKGAKPLNLICKWLTCWLIWLADEVCEV